MKDDVQTLHFTALKKGKKKKVCILSICHHRSEKAVVGLRKVGNCKYFQAFVRQPIGLFVRLLFCGPITGSVLFFSQGLP